MRDTLIDESGNRYGLLVVLTRGPNKGLMAAWFCQCDCGNQVLRTGSQLRKESIAVKSCGCTYKNRIDELGNVYGKLTVIARADNKRSAQAWVCKCECGNEIIASGYNLRNHGSKSCGCTRYEDRPRKYSLEDSTWAKLYRQHQATKEARGFLEYDVWREIIAQNCYYCGDPPRIHKAKCGSEVYASGVDRYDNDIGYEIENSVSCCTPCNFQKGSMHGDDFIAENLRVARNVKKLNRQPRRRPSISALELGD